MGFVALGLFIIARSCDKFNVSFKTLSNDLSTCSFCTGSGGAIFSLAIVLGKPV